MDMNIVFSNFFLSMNTIEIANRKLVPKITENSRQSKKFQKNSHKL